MDPQMQQLMAQMGEMMTALRETQAQLQTVVQERQAERTAAEDKLRFLRDEQLKGEARMAELRDMVGRVASGGSQRAMVDTKNVGKPGKLSNMKQYVTILLIAS